MLDIIRAYQIVGLSIDDALDIIRNVWDKWKGEAFSRDKIWKLDPRYEQNILRCFFIFSSASCLA